MKYEKMNFIKVKMLFYIFCSILIASSLLHGGCSQMPLQRGKENKKTIGDIAYDTNSKKECLLYIKESNVFEPYIVITSVIRVIEKSRLYLLFYLCINERPPR